MILSEEQLEIATSMEPVIAAFASAGSGKTATLVERVDFLLDQGVKPDQIVIITFTRKAAGEISDRIGNREILCGTFHSVCLQWIKDHSELCGFPYGISGVLGEAELSQCVAMTGREFDGRHAAETGAIGFDQIISIAVRLITEHGSSVLPDQCHLIVDEAQDSSADQWALVDAVIGSGRAATTMIVGDFRQSIYEWRSACPQLGMDFCSRDGVKQFYLADNYRSSAEIVDVANRLIACGGFTEPMRSMSDEPGSVRFIRSPYVPSSISEEIARLEGDLVPLEEIAVLCRYNESADRLAAQLRAEGFDVCRPKPPNNEAISRLCAWANAHANPFNLLSWSAMTNHVLSVSDRRSVVLAAAKRGTTLTEEAMRVLEPEIAERLAEFAMKDPPRQIQEEFMEKAWLAFGGSHEEYAAIIQPLAGMEFSELPEELSLTARTTDGEQGGVNVLTMHSCKGLEYDSVLITDCHQSSMPGRKKGRKKEEERRLLYVATTRAQRTLAYLIPEGEEWSEFIADEHGKPIA